MELGKIQNELREKQHRTQNKFKKTEMILKHIKIKLEQQINIELRKRNETQTTQSWTQKKQHRTQQKQHEARRKQNGLRQKKNISRKTK